MWLRCDGCGISCHARNVASSSLLLVQSTTPAPHKYCTRTSVFSKTQVNKNYLQRNWYLITNPQLTLLHVYIKFTIKYLWASRTTTVVWHWQRPQEARHWLISVLYYLSRLLQLDLLRYFLNVCCNMQPSVLVAINQEASIWNRGYPPTKINVNNLNFTWRTKHCWRIFSNKSMYQSWNQYFWWRLLSKFSLQWSTGLLKFKFPFGMRYTNLLNCNVSW